MKSVHLILLFCFIFFLFSSAQSNLKPEKKISSFSLLNINNKQVSLFDYPSAKGFIVVFTSNHCPFAKLYPKRMNELNIKYAPLGVPLIAISSTDTIMYEEDTYDKMVQKSKKEKFNFPYLYDGTQQVAKEFGADKTPHAFVIWRDGIDWKIMYNGAIDDNGAEPSMVTINYVGRAIDELLKGLPVSISETKSIGCKIHFRKENKN